MPLELTDAGLTIQSLAEIKAELEAEHRAEFGDNIPLGHDSVFGNQIAIYSEREAKLQALALAVYSSFDPNKASGRALDARAAMTATFRKPATKSISASFQANGVAATNITDGRRFQLIQTGDVWVVTGGPYVIGGGGSVAITAEAEETGPKTFVTSGPSAWEILTPVAGWTSVESTADIDPEDTGRNVESDAELRARRRDSLLKDGNDLEAIRVAVQDLNGVSTVATFENTDCNNTVDGIPPGAFEVVADGGDDAEIVEAIYANKPPGAESFGSILTPRTTSSGQVITIGHTRPTDIDIHVIIDVDTTGAEYSIPLNAEDTIRDAFLVAANAIAQIARDQIPQVFTSTVFESIRTAEGKDTATAVTITFALAAPGPYSEDPIVIAIRERGDFDSARVTVNIT